MGKRIVIDLIISLATRQPEYFYYALIIIWIHAHFKDNGKSTWFLCCSGESYAGVNMSALLSMHVLKI